MWSTAVLIMILNLTLSTSFQAELAVAHASQGRAEEELREVERKWKASETTLSDYRSSMESQLVEKRREAREGEGGSRQEAVDTVRIQEVCAP